MGQLEDPKPELEVSLRRTPEAVVVEVRGELDTTNAERLRQAVDSALDTSSSPTVVFDLAGLRFMDSSGIAVLLSVAAGGKAVRLRSPSPIIREVIAATGLGDVLPEEP